MKKKKRLAVLFLMVTALSSMLIGCGKKTESNDIGGDVGNSDKIVLGVCQLVQHGALDAAYEGFIAGLEEAGYKVGVNLEVIYDVAGGDKENCQTIASKFVNKDVDLMLGIATDAAQACANATKDIPVFVTAVTDPAESGIVLSNEKPGGNVTGTSDMTPIKEQLELLVRLVPDVKKIAVLYCSNESNSQIQGDIALAEAEALGLETVVITVSQTSEIQTVIESVVGKVDAIYTPTDNMIAANMETVSMIATANFIPVIPGEEGMVMSGGLATYGLSYYNLGKQTAEMAVRVLNGEEETADMPIEYLRTFEFVYNQEIADALGITIPEDLMK